MVAKKSLDLDHGNKLQTRHFGSRNKTPATLGPEMDFIYSRLIMVDLSYKTKRITHPPSIAETDFTGEKELEKQRKQKDNHVPFAAVSCLLGTERD